MCGMVLLLGNASKYMYDCISGVHHQEREEKERLFNAVETVSWIALVFILEVRLLSLGQSPQICTVRHCVTSKNQMSDPLSYREINKSLSFKCTKGQRNHCGHPLRAHMHRQEFFEF